MKKYSTKFDCFYDEEKDIWLEKKCDDKECPYCINRPEKPSMFKGELK